MKFKKMILIFKKFRKKIIVKKMKKISFAKEIPSVHEKSSLSMKYLLYEMSFIIIKQNFWGIYEMSYL